MPWNLKLHDYVAIGHDVEVYNYSPVTIGSMTVVSQYCYLCTGTHDYMSREMPLVSHPITVGSQVWVCAGAWVLPGTTIAEGCVVGARSVIRGITSPWSVYAGNPATLIKSRIIREK
jgi:putative colanic acid biosynthesis acetyltransferase WcaF